MTIIKEEIPLTQNPVYKCPNSGLNLLSEEMEDCILRGDLALAIHSENPAEYIKGTEALMASYEKFVQPLDFWDYSSPTEVIQNFMQAHGLDKTHNLHEVEVNAMACGPIRETQWFIISINKGNS